MKEYDILEAIGDINPKYVNNASTSTTVKKSNHYFRWIAIAACLCLVTILTLVSITNNVKTEDNNEAINEAIDVTDGIYIPPVKLPESDSTVEADMIGLVVYNGNIYTQAADYFDSEVQKIESLIGEHLGTAMGNINEWSSKNEFSNEFASTIPGEIYAVNGYDTDFRICIKLEYEDQNGNPAVHIQFLEKLNDITLNTGKDLFETKLHIKDNINTIYWQSHNDWNLANNNLHKATINSDTWSEFLDHVDRGIFTVFWNPDIINGSSIYDTEKQIHLILEMKDGTTLRLILIEGGYVGYNSLNWYLVKIPENIFNTVYDSCGGIH